MIYMRMISVNVDWIHVA